MMQTVRANAERGVFIDIYALLDAQTGADNGVWVDTRGAYSITLVVAGIGTGTLQLRGHHPTDGITAPTNSNHHEAIGADITADNQYGVVFADVPHWVKMRKSAAGDSTSTTVIAHIKYRS